MMKETLSTSYLFGSNAPFIEELYERRFRKKKANVVRPPVRSPEEQKRNAVSPPAPEPENELPF